MGEVDDEGGHAGHPLLFAELLPRAPYGLLEQCERLLRTAGVGFAFLAAGNLILSARRSGPIGEHRAKRRAREGPAAPG